MKHKRMAIMFVLVTLAGSPPIWQKLGSFISAVQHKAQIKFLSMVLRPGTDDAAAIELPTARDEIIASCPDSTLEYVKDGVTDQAATKLRKYESSFTHRARPEVSKLESANLAARSEKVESLSHLGKLKSALPPAAGAPAVVTIPVELSLNENDIRELAKLQQKDFSLATLSENSVLHLKLKKFVEEHKSTRQRTRFVIGRPFVAPPAPKTEVVDSEREG